MRESYPGPTPSRHPLKKIPAGFTLVELLVVIAIIGILIALLLPAVQRAREASNRTACGNRLRQVGNALHTYASVNQRNGDGYFPAGSWWNGTMPGTNLEDGDAGMSNNQPNGFSWVIAILPYCEEDLYYNSLNTFATNNGSQPWSRDAYLNLMETAYWGGIQAAWRFRYLRSDIAALENFIKDSVLDTFLCPSWKGLSVRTGSFTTWRGNHGKNDTYANSDDGAFKWISNSDAGVGWGFGEFSDGLSKTALVWERNDNWGSSWASCPDRNIIFGRSTYGFYDRITAGNTNSPMILTGATNPSGPNPNSDHAGGIFNLVMADGSTVAINGGISTKVFASMCTRKGKD